MEQALTSSGQWLVQQGLLGIAVIFLLWYIGRLQQELKDLRDAHKVELAAKDKTIMELQEARLAENRSGWELASATKTTLDAFLRTVTGDKS